MKTAKSDSGCYQLLIKLEYDRRVKIGALGPVLFKAGYYIYTGRAKRGLESRVRRHLGETKKKHWHIDYLLEKCEIVDIFYYRGRLDECIINGERLKGLKKHRIIRKFGSSDCKCSGHLIWTDERPPK